MVGDSPLAPDQSAMRRTMPTRLLRSGQAMNRQVPWVMTCAQTQTGEEGPLLLVTACTHRQAALTMGQANTATQVGRHAHPQTLACKLHVQGLAAPTPQAPTGVRCLLHLRHFRVRTRPLDVHRNSLMGSFSVDCCLSSTGFHPQLLHTRDAALVKRCRLGARSAAAALPASPAAPAPSSSCRAPCWWRKAAAAIQWRAAMVWHTRPR